MSSISQLQKRRILVIDDNPAIHDDFRKILSIQVKEPPGLEATEAALFGTSTTQASAQAFEIDFALQGKEAMEMVRLAVEEDRPYQMAFVDIRMPPGWDGVETIQRLWEIYPDIQIVICTAYSDYSWDEITERLGASDNLVILKKPFDNIEVLQLAYSLTKKWSLNQLAKSKLKQLDQMVCERTEELQVANRELEKENAERERAEKALRLSEERFAKAFSNNPLPMLIYSLKDERCVDVNLRFLKMLDYQPQEVIGQPLAELHILSDEQRWATMREQLQRSRFVHSSESTLRTRSGQLRNTLLWAEVMEVAAVTCVLLIIDDITDRRNLENELLQVQKMDAIGQLASGVAHDFNNILTVIQGHVELLIAGTDEASSSAGSLKQIALASSRAAALTRQLLTFSHKQAVQPKVLNLAHQLHQLNGILGRLIGEHIHLHCTSAPNLPHIFADPCNIEQIIMNLAVNARDAMPHGGKLTITAAPVQINETHLRGHPGSRPGQYVCLIVSDTGCGIETEFLPRIFEPFFTTKEVGKGTGLGLATVYGIVRQLNGWIEVESKHREGATFKVYLPTYEGPLRDQPVEKPSEKPHQKNATILAVEDEDSLRELSCSVLKAAGYQVLEAADGVEALKIWNDNHSRIDLLFTDIVMPNGITGRELAAKLHSDRGELKVLFTSGYSPELIGQDSVLAQGHHFLAKPFTPQDLLRAIHECLSSVELKPSSSAQLELAAS